MTTSSSSRITYKVWMKPLAYQKMTSVIKEVDAEVGGFGYVSQQEIPKSIGRHFLIVEDIAPLPYQEVSSGGVDAGTKDTILDLPSLAEWYGEPCNCSLREDQHLIRDHSNELLFSWHSHANMSAYFSPVDTTQILDFMAQTRMPYLISHVQNKNGASKTRIDQFRPFAVGSEDIDMDIIRDPYYSDWAEEQVQQRVTVKAKPTGHTDTGSGTKTGSGSGGSSQKTTSSQGSTQSGMSGGSQSGTKGQVDRTSSSQETETSRESRSTSRSDKKRERRAKAETEIIRRLRGDEQIEGEEYHLLSEEEVDHILDKWGHSRESAGEANVMYLRRMKGDPRLDEYLEDFEPSRT